VTTQVGRTSEAGYLGDGQSPDAVISVSGLVKRYGDVEAVRGIDFEVARGETFGFLGPNGAGKTTTIKILCTLANATAGRALVAGYDSATSRDAVRRNIGLVFQDTTLDTYLTAEQNLRFHAELYGVPKAAVEPRMRQVMDMVGLWDRKDSLVSTYSGGMQRRLEIARGLLHAPHVLFLDEPTVGLDPQTRSSIWAYINDLKKREDITIFLTTHYMDEAQALADRVAIINAGVIIASGRPDELGGRDSRPAEIRFMLPAGVALEDVPEVRAQSRTLEGDRVLIVTREPVLATNAITGWALDGDLELSGFSVAQPTLEDIYLELTGSGVTSVLPAKEKVLR
jgi:ABC-2 type transport system ATP-binding protein